MNKEWVETKTREQEERFQSDISELIRKIKASKYLKNCQIEEIVNLLQEKNYLKASSRLERVTLERFDDATIDELIWSVKISTEIIEFFRKQRFEDYAEYADTEVMEFNGDIVITDPCYIFDEYNNPDWFKNTGITNYLLRSTIYGDWSCNVMDTETGEILGTFCADAGLVSVFSVSDVLAYGNGELNNDYSMTIIKNFKGKVQIVVEYNGTVFYEYSVHVIGEGINKETGEKICFKSYHCGF